MTVRRWRWGSIAMAGGWVHTVHSAHGQMEQFFCSDVSKMINKQWKHSEHRAGISTSNCLGWTMSFTLRIGYYTVKWRGLLARIDIITWDVNIWEFLQDSTSANKSQAESAEAITSSEPPAQLHSPDIVHLPQIVYNWWISVQGKHKHPFIFIGSAAYWCLSRQTFGDLTEESRLNFLRPNDDYSYRLFALGV